MPFDLSPTAFLYFYSLIFLSQIYVISVHYPRAMAERTSSMLRNYPPAEFPKLYPDAPNDPAAMVAYGIKKECAAGIYRGVNYLIAVVGLALLAWLHISGYTPSPKGGGEIFVIVYFFLQAGPLVYAAYREYSTYKKMRETFSGARTRSAALAPRRLFDYISPLWFTAAAALYAIWLAVFLGVTPEDSTAVGEERYFTIVIITGMNLMYALIIRQHISGTKIDPYQTTADREQTTRTAVRVLTVSSVMVSVFLIFTQLADVYNLEAFDPVVASLYLQLCIILAIGETLNSIKLDQMNFDVYKEGGRQIQS